MKTVQNFGNLAVRELSEVPVIWIAHAWLLLEISGQVYLE
jgi:hypothetical protein